FDTDLKRLADDMLETMYAAPGIGLAATQVNVPKRLLVLDASETHDDPQVFVNPELLETRGTEVCQEGCLSFPGVYADVERKEWIRVRAQDVRTRNRRPARGVYPARDGSPGRQGVRRLSVAAETFAAAAQAGEAAASRGLTRSCRRAHCGWCSPAHPNSRYRDCARALMPIRTSSRFTRNPTAARDAGANWRPVR